MSVSNSNLFLFFRGLLVLLLFLTVADFLLSGIPGSLGSYFQDHYLAYTCIALILILTFIRINFFSYEDEYEIIHIRAKSLLFGKLSGTSNARYEFPKGILYDFSFKRGFFKKKLTIVLKTSNSKEKKVRHFNLLFVSAPKINYVLNSLQKVKERNLSQKKQETI